MSVLTHRHSSYILQIRTQRAIAVGIAWYLEGVRKRTLGLLASGEGRGGALPKENPRHKLVILPQTCNFRKHPDSRLSSALK